MSKIEDEMVGKEAAKVFKQIFNLFPKEYRESLSNESIDMLSWIFFFGFSKGYDFRKSCSILDLIENSN